MLLRLFHRWPYNVPACLWFDCQLRLEVQLVGCWNRRSLLEAQRSLHTWYGIRLPWSQNRMTRLLLHTCVFQASLSNVHHKSGYRDLAKGLSFQSPDFVHCTHHYTDCICHLNWRWPLLPVNWLLVLLIQRKHWYKKLRGRRGSWFILRFFIVLV